MKITLEPRKTTWVPFIDSKAKLEIEWTAKIEYTSWSASQNSTHSVDMRYIFTGLDGAQSPVVGWTMSGRPTLRRLGSSIPNLA